MVNESRYHGIYVGPIDKLRGKTALVMDHPNRLKVRVQFYELQPGRVRRSWKLYDRADWKLEKKP